MDREGIAFPYLQAIDGTGLGVRVMPIGAMHFGMTPWNLVSHLFMTALKTRFINVVAIEPGTSLGAPISSSQFGRAGSGEEAAYQPSLALSGLFTVGIPNVAIISGVTMPKDKEIDSLRHYTAVVCCTDSGVQDLGKLGVKAVKIPAESDQLSRLFSGMMPA